ncbi:MAG: hypothetical protein MJK04_11895 [Psychrosphaera sp.]|nr:hypothetical protein [Psychrosphaera sp.]
MFLAHIAAQYYFANPNIFDAANIAAQVYAIGRRLDINTVTLVLLILVGRVIDSMLLYDMEIVDGYIGSLVFLLFNVVAITII